MTIAERPARPKAPSQPKARPRPKPRNVLAEIAARRRADVADLAPTDLRAAAPEPRDIIDRLVAPGIHLIAEVKRRSPSAGDIAPTDDLVTRARAYEAGGAAAISVLCEPHWFGGSIDDLRAVRAAVRIPVLAKEFVVDARQLDQLRAAGADLVLLLAALHPPKRLASLVTRARRLGMEPLVEAHDEREVDSAVATGATLIGLNNRDLRTLEVDLERAERLRDRVPDDRLVIAELGVRDAATVARWRAAGFDAALVGEALMRSPDPAAAARAFVTSGRPPTDPANLARIPFVKICGVTDAEGLVAAVAAGADAIGLNVVLGTPRHLDARDVRRLAMLARTAAPLGSRPLIVAITADATDEHLARVVAEGHPDAIQLSGEEPVERVAGLVAAGHRVWKTLHLPADGMADGVRPVIERARAFLAAGAELLLLDTQGGPYPGGTGRRIGTDLAAAVAREVPVVLAGGLDPANVAEALHDIAAVGVDVSSGVEGRALDDGRTVGKDRRKVATFVKRARAARQDRPVVRGPADAGRSRPPRGRWGRPLGH